MYSKIDYNSNKNPGPIFSKEKRLYMKGKVNSFSRVKMFSCSNMYLERIKIMLRVLQHFILHAALGSICIHYSRYPSVHFFACIK